MDALTRTTRAALARYMRLRGRLLPLLLALLTGIAALTVRAQNLVPTVSSSSSIEFPQEYALTPESKEFKEPKESEVSPSPFHEEIVMVKKPGWLSSVKLETTIFRPPGPGPFPVVIINHGKANGLAREQPRARYPNATRTLVENGFMVVLPMRQGFAQSDGEFQTGWDPCDIAQSGKEQAEDVLATLAYLRTRAEASRSNIILVGHSLGGLISLAAASEAPEGVRAVVNFAGGWRNRLCKEWPTELIHAMRVYGSKTRIPTLWFYGENDSFWSPSLYRAMHQQYLMAGAKAELVETGRFQNDAHTLFESREGLSLWLPRLERFLQQNGLFTPMPTYQTKLQPKGRKSPLPPVPLAKSPKAL